MDSGNSEIDPNQIDIDLGHISVRDPTTRDILRRQMEKGNITHSDITTLQKYQGSWNYSRIGLLGGALVTSIWGRFIRRPPLTMGRMFGLSSFAAFTGASIGTGIQVREGIRAVGSLENPDRFKKALVEMSQEVIAQRQAALRRATSQSGQQSAPQDGEHTKLADGWDSGGVREPIGPPSSAGPPAESRPAPDRWSQLRAQKQPAQPTTWDTIRQTHERPTPKPSGQTQDKPSDPSNDTERQRRQSQAEFDALLERERNVGQDEVKELKSRWS